VRPMVMFLVMFLAACAPEDGDSVDEDAGVETDADVIEDTDVEPDADEEEESDADIEEEPPPGCDDLDEDSDSVNVLACCLTESGAWYYHTFWCPFCLIQQRMFGEYFELLNEMECYDLETWEELPECTELGFESYPVWIFGDGTEVGGLLHYEQLAEYSGCYWE